MYRDPRDSWISYTRFITYSETARLISPGYAKFQKYIQDAFENDDDRLEHILKHCYHYYSVLYLPWLESKYAHVIRFEDLYPDILKLKEGVWGDTIKGILKYLEVDLNTIDPIKFHEDTFENSITASDEPDKVGQYKKYFKEKHYELVSRPERARIIKAFGYDL